MSDARLPARLEAAAIMRLAESQGGFATVLARGGDEGGTILLAILCRGEPAALLERMPSADGSRNYVAVKTQALENAQEFSAYCERRARQDSDLWVIEVAIDDWPRFAAFLPQ